jgi:5-oxopent-3-ene-1,2,5-tricarboxylate decarboxylase/2-hydroxyhepta-2,4-diene-1,7-dioate isomerase
MSRRARVAFGGAIHEAVPHARGLQLADGRVLAEAQVVWLPPFEVGTIIALGINYADHARELAKELTIGAQDEPLAFLKAPNSLIGHRGFTRRHSLIIVSDKPNALFIRRTVSNNRDFRRADFFFS